MVRMDDMGVLCSLIQRLEDELTPQVDEPEHFFPFISLPMNEFLISMRDIDRLIIEQTHAHSQPKFLDIGCGIGTKLITVNYLGYQPFGFDICNDYLDVAKKIAPMARVWNGSAFSDRDLSEFDVVYSYRLCRDESIQQELNKYIISQMRPGALLFLAGTKLNYDPVGDQVWRA